MNENGWGLKDVVLFIVIISLALFISMIIYNRTVKELFGSVGSATDYENETYEDIEKDLEQTAHTYTDNYYDTIIEPGDSGVVTIRDMQAEKLLTVVRDIKDDSKICSGYVKFKNKDGVTTYTTYLNCGDSYQTSGYQEKYDEPVKGEKELARERISE